MQEKLLELVLILTFFSMSAFQGNFEESPRPIYHFTAPQFWINDPNGLIYYKGEYHLFYQHNPFGNEWGHMTWGHAKSRDLVKWTHLPVAIPEQKDHMIFSGCVVHDQKNSSGLGSATRGPLIALYTAHREGHQAQHLAYSNDNGLQWALYKNNPVLDLKKRDFRDPNVFWHEATARWIMAVVLPNEFKVQFYASKNLIKWDLLSDFGGHPSFKEIWECPALFPLPVKNQKDKTKWVLLISTNREYSSMRYFTGEFDGTSFRCDHALDQVNKVDAGRDFYAAIPFYQAPGQKRILLGWMNNWAYANQNPTAGWKGMMTTARELGLQRETEGSYRLLQLPVDTLQAIRTNKREYLADPNTKFDAWDIQTSPAMEWQINLDSHKGAVLDFDFGRKAKLLVTWDAVRHQLCLDRTSKTLAFHPAYPSIDCLAVSPGHNLTLQILMDHYSMEIFSDNGKAALTSVFFAPGPLQKFRITGKQFHAKTTLWDLNPQIP